MASWAPAESPCTRLLQDGKALQGRLRGRVLEAGGLVAPELRAEGNLLQLLCLRVRGALQ